MPILKNLFHEYSSVLNWVFIYTMEAHAVDEWPISSARYEPTGKPVCISKHKSIEDRLEAAKNFCKVFDVPFATAVDTAEDEFESLFCTWPFRFYVLHRKRVIYQAQPKDGLVTYGLEPLVEVLQKFALQT